MIDNIRPILDRILIRREKPEEMSSGGILYPSSMISIKKRSHCDARVPVFGQVLAVGSKVNEENVTVGDRVVFEDWCGVEIEGEEGVVMMKEQDIVAVV